MARPGKHGGSCGCFDPRPQERLFPEFVTRSVNTQPNTTIAALPAFADSDNIFLSTAPGNTSRALAEKWWSDNDAFLAARVAPGPAPVLFCLEAQLRAFALAIAIVYSLFVPHAGALAAGRSPGGFDKPPSNEQIRDKLRDICSALLQDEDKLSAPVANNRCGCYANGVVKAMSNGEIDEMRVTGKFSPSAQPKAKKFMLTCKVKT